MPGKKGENPHTIVREIENGDNLIKSYLQIYIPHDMEMNMFVEQFYPGFRLIDYV